MILSTSSSPSSLPSGPLMSSSQVAPTSSHSSTGAGSRRARPVSRGGGGSSQSVSQRMLAKNGCERKASIECKPSGGPAPNRSSGSRTCAIKRKLDQTKQGIQGHHAHQKAPHEVGGFRVEAFGESIIELLDLLPCEILG